jgi:dCTP deaminase
MILSDREADLAMDKGWIMIRPRPGQAFMDSTALDLCLGDTLDRWEFSPRSPGLGPGEPRFCPGARDFKFSDIERNHTRHLPIPEAGYELPPSYRSTPETGPQHFILGWTRERIYLPHTSRLCARVEGKSSLGRMGLGVHVTAPTIHAGFGYNRNDNKDHGAPLRLEIWNVGPLPVVLVKGMRICQLILEEVREVPRAGHSGEFNVQGPRPQEPPTGSRRRRGR